MDASVQAQICTASLKRGERISNGPGWSRTLDLEVSGSTMNIGHSAFSCQNSKQWMNAFPPPMEPHLDFSSLRAGRNHPLPAFDEFRRETGLRPPNNASTLPSLDLSQ